MFKQHKIPLLYNIDLMKVLPNESCYKIVSYDCEINHKLSGFFVLISKENIVS
jgi:hypothetical protein